MGPLLSKVLSKFTDVMSRGVTPLAQSLKNLAIILATCIALGTGIAVAGDTSSETGNPFPTPFGECEKPLKSGHIVFNCFGSWSVRKVFSRKAKELRYTDMKTKMRMSDGRDVTFQINRRASDGDWSVILGGWIDRVEFEIDGEVTNVMASMRAHTFYGDPGNDFYRAFANAKTDIKLRAYISERVYRAKISHKGAGEALKYLGLKP